MKQFSPLTSLKWWFLLALAISSYGLQAQGTKKTILFIGNSYTFYNDLPNLVRQLALAAGDTLIVDSHTPGGSNFQQHAANPTVLQKIQSRKWDYVVLQEQSQRPAFPPAQTEVEVFPFAQQLRDQILANHPCTQILFYMTWGRKNGDAMNCGFYPPVCTYAGMQERLSITYRELGRRNNAVVVPVGMSWKESIRTDPNYELFDPDQSHPALSGSYLTAVTFFSTIYKRTAVGLNFNGGLPAAEADRLKNIGSQTVLDSLGEWRKNLPAVRADFDFNQTPETREIVFTNTSSPNAIRYKWNFADGGSGTSVSAAPKHTFSAPGVYDVQLVAENDCISDTIIQAVEVKDFGKCDVPVALPFTLQGNDLVLSWNPLRAGAQYEVSYRVPDSTNWTVLPLTGNTTATVTGVRPCMPYRVRYRSFCGGQFSDYSPEQLINSLATPAVTQVRFVSATSCLVEWNPIGGAVYQVQFRERGRQSWTSTAFNIRATRRMLINLRSRAAYEIRVVARCESDTARPPKVEISAPQDYSHVPAINNCASNVPSPPFDLGVFNETPTGATLKWKNIPGSVGTVLSFGPAGTNPNFWMRQIVCFPTDSLKLRNLRPNTRYSFFLQSACTNCHDLSNRNRRSAASPTLSFATLATRLEDEESTIFIEPLAVYPNPNKGTFQISGGAGLEAALFNMTGQLVWQQTLTESETEVSPSNLAPGIYVLKAGTQTVKIWVEE